MFRGLFTAEQLFDGIFTVTHSMGWGGMVEARLAKASTRVGGYGLRVGSARLPYPSRQKSQILARKGGARNPIRVTDSQTCALKIYFRNV